MSLRLGDLVRAGLRLGELVGLGRANSRSVRGDERLQSELEEAEERVARLRLAVAGGPCSRVGHAWRHVGGRNAGCDQDCVCSVPVNVCEKCGDSDYGDNEEARGIMERCAGDREDEGWPVES